MLEFKQSANVWLFLLASTYTERERDLSSLVEESLWYGHKLDTISNGLLNSIYVHFATGRAVVIIIDSRSTTFLDFLYSVHRGQACVGIAIIYCVYGVRR